MHSQIASQPSLMQPRLPADLLPIPATFTSRVRDLVIPELGGGQPTATRIASLLHMSTRTLTRRLEREGTNFKAQLDEIRRGMALKCLAETNLTVSELAFRLGFNRPPAFHRAFKRWTGKTPLEHRRCVTAPPPAPDVAASLVGLLQA